MASQGTAAHTTACPTSSTAAAPPFCAGGALATGSDCPCLCPQLTCNQWLSNDYKQRDDLDIDEEDVSDRCAKQRLLQLLIRMHINQHLFRLHRQSMILSEACKATSPCAVALAIKSHAVYQQTSRHSS